MARFRLIFRPDDKFGALGGAFVEVCPTDKGDGHLVLTHGCSPAELKSEIASLKAELDDVLKEGLAKSAAHMRAKEAARERDEP